ncbi:MAG: GNAT family N-acetyltransferase [Candidatus Cloacimonetes bacterium]|nr:GNAT family N-acetyltransferase [Candidatus Cloacimonadota bacterium]
MNYTIDLVDPDFMDEQLLKKYLDLFNELQSETYSDDPPRTYEQFVRYLRNVSDSEKVYRWLAVVKGNILGDACCFINKEGENRHIAYVNIQVGKNYRQKGIGKALLQHVVEKIQNDGIEIIDFMTVNKPKAGSIFLHRMGAQIGQTNHINQLEIADLDYTLMDNWITRGRQANRDFQLEFWKNEYPEDRIAAYVKLYNEFWNSVPMDELEYRWENISEKWLRDSLRAILAKGWEYWLLVARNKVNSELAGFTTLIYTGYRRDLMNQDDTGVAERYRNRGLGRWLKAVMIKKLILEKPYIRIVRTENALSNGPMLRINQEMGFRNYLTEEIWQIRLQAIVDYLK